MQNVLITGGSGLLGQYLNLTASRSNNILSIYNAHIGNCGNFNSRRLDINDSKELTKVFNSFKPSVVLHTAAITNPVVREEQRTKSYYNVNVIAAEKIAELCEMNKSRLIYISTDLVYAGYRGSMLDENSKLIPASLYAETKLMGEVKIKSVMDNYVILRTALLYGIGLNHSRCHFHLIYNELKNGKPVKLFTDQFRTPISLNDAAQTISKIASMDLKGETINLGGRERISRFELGEILCKIGGYEKNLLQNIKMDDFPEFPKVEDVSLNTDKLQSLGIKLNTVEENILRILREN